MGRKSRNYLHPEQQEVALQPIMPVWDTGIYARLSIENSKKNDDGDSIEGQIEICRDYVAEHPYLHLVETYVDNGWTGTNTERPEFQRLLRDIQDGKVKALVLKDFSRFSRNYIEAGNLLENIFPAMGIRFISVVDRYDSFETDGSSDSLLIPLKNLINSYYSRDQSKKVSIAIHAKQMAGEHIPSMIPYGYRKSTSQAYRFEPDPETAPIVKRIFESFLNGKGARPIVQMLNDEGIPSPGKLRYLRGLTDRKCYSDCIWSQQGVKQILINQTYCGDLVFGRMPTALYLGKPNYHYEPDESKWRILPDMHDPLVSREDFAKVQSILKEGKSINQEKLAVNAEYRATHPQMFKSGIVRCGVCGSNLGFCRKADTPNGVYICRNKQYGRCTETTSIKEDVLVPIVWNAVQDQLVLYTSLDDVLRRMRGSSHQTNRMREMQREMQTLSQQLNRCQQKREHLYTDYAEHILSVDEYTELKTRFDTQVQEQNIQLSQLSVELAKLQRILSTDNKWMKNLSGIVETSTLTPELAETLIDHISVFHAARGQKRVEIVFRFQEERDTLTHMLQETEGVQENE